MTTDTIEVVLVKSDKVLEIPQYKTEGAAGADLISVESLTLTPGGTHKVSTGISVAIPEGYAGFVVSRSGLASKGIVVANSPGIIDSDYRGEIGVLLRNTTPAPVDIPAGTRVAQLLIMPVIQARFVIVDTLTTTVRGSGGFGSTGT